MKRNFNPSITDEKLDAVRERLLDLAGLPGFPTEERALEITSRAYAKFIRNQEWDRPDLGGKVRDLDWLVETILDTCERFPAPIRAREIYEQFFSPDDGRTSDSMGATGVAE